MTYTELYEKVYGDEPFDLDSLDAATRKAWQIIKALDDRKGFDWWWRAHDFSDESRDEIFEEMKAILTTP